MSLTFLITIVVFVVLAGAWLIISAWLEQRSKKVHGTLVNNPCSPIAICDDQPNMCLEEPIKIITKKEEPMTTKIKVGRSAETGKFISIDKAKKDKKGAIVQTIKRKSGTNKKTTKRSTSKCHK